MKFRFGRLHYLITFVTIVIFLFILQLVYPKIKFISFFHNPTKVSQKQQSDSILAHAKAIDEHFMQKLVVFRDTDAQGQPLRHRVVSVPDFKTSFPDLNDVQLATAKEIGLSSPILNRKDAVHASDKLVYIGDNPFYRVETLHQSIPYLVPKAAILLEEIARSFMDSCLSKGIGLHKIVITSVTRTQEDVQQLRRFNHNASENSCHMYGTTFDIGYNKYDRVNDPDGVQRPTEWGVKLKSILAEVLNDKRNNGTCYIKYEYRKPCFHITAR